MYIQWNLCWKTTPFCCESVASQDRRLLVTGFKYFAMQVLSEIYEVFQDRWSATAADLQEINNIGKILKFVSRVSCQIPRYNPEFVPASSTSEASPDFECHVEVYCHKQEDMSMASTPKRIRKKIGEFSNSVGRRLSGLVSFCLYRSGADAGGGLGGTCPP